MKKIQIVPAAMFSLILIGTATLGYAQHDDQRGSQDKHDRQAQSQGKQPTQPQREAQGSRQPSHGQERPEQKPQPTRNDHAQTRPAQASPAHNQPSQQRDNWQQHRATNFDSQHRSWEQRGGYNGYRVPDARFSSSFGRGHSFHIFGLPYGEYGGLPRFQYGGYWLSMMEPYPEYWGANWDRNDDMYVDFTGGGYYLYDRRFPGRPGVALSISL